MSEPTDASSVPRIYVASVADYTYGNHHGRWFDANVEPSELVRAVREFIQTSPTVPGATAYCIEDDEGFSTLRIDTFEPLERVARWARGVAERGEAFAVWVRTYEIADEHLDSFEDAYLGWWPTAADHAESYLGDLGIDPDAIGPDRLQPYIAFDLEKFGRDLLAARQIIQGQQGVYAFEQ